MKRNFFSLRSAGFLLSGLLVMIACNKFKTTPIQEAFLEDGIPEYSVGSGEAFNAQIHLGRVLFYDKNLSINNSISCASCHKQELAFADNKAQSIGFENRLTGRNSMAIQNIAPPMGSLENAPLFWDGRETDLFSLISKPIANHIEMGMDDANRLVDKLNRLPYYQPILDKAYGPGEKLTMANLSQAVAMFLTNIRASNSKFDQSKFGGSNLNALESQGEMLFNTTYQCSNCHNPSVGFYISSGFHNIGLETNNQDKGRMNVTSNSSDEGKFKAPDLHNVALTAPYMHDGRFKTLNEVLDHYSHGIQENKNLSSVLRNNDGSALRMNISEQDRKALIAFLESMTDYTMITNPQLSNPFKLR